MKKNILFLDFDGVINNNTSKISIESLNILKQLINMYNLKIVPITSWLGHATTNKKKKIIGFLNNCGITDIDGFIDPNFEGYFLDIKLSSRIIGIIDYLKKNPEINYIILDDEYFNEYHLLGLNYIKVNSKKGLQWSDIKEFNLKNNNHKHLNKVSYKYRDISKLNYLKNTNDLIKVLKKVYESRDKI